MGGKQYIKEDVKQVEALIGQGLTGRDIAQRLNRSEAAIRNLRYRKRLVKKVEDETKLLFQRRNELRDTVEDLNEEHQTLTYNVASFTQNIASLKGEKEKLESIIKLDKFILQTALTQALTGLKQQRPDLFMLSGQEQSAFIIGEFVKRILQ